SPLNRGDDDSLCRKKISIVANFIDILIARRLSNFRDISSSAMQYAMYRAMRDIRAKSPAEIAEILTQRLKEDTQPFSSSDQPFGLHGMNRKPIQRILARMTDYIEQQSGMPPHFQEYVSGSAPNRYEVEHIWADHPERHLDEFQHPADFQSVRSRIGDLVLLPYKFNRSFGDLDYEEKLEHYYGQ